MGLGPRLPPWAVTITGTLLHCNTGGQTVLESFYTAGAQWFAVELSSLGPLYASTGAVLTLDAAGSSLSVQLYVGSGECVQHTLALATWQARVYIYMYICIAIAIVRRSENERICSYMGSRKSRSVCDCNIYVYIYLFSYVH